MAELHIALGEFDAAFEWMERAIAVDPAAQKIIRESDDYDPVRDDPRFRALIGE